MEVDDTGKHVGMSVLEGRYQVGFAPVSAWSEAGLDVACNCTMSAPASSSSLIALPCTAQLANASITDGSDSGEAGFMVNENDNAGSYENQRLKVVVVFPCLLWTRSLQIPGSIFHTESSKTGSGIPARPWRLS